MCHLGRAGHHSNYFQGEWSGSNPPLTAIAHRMRAGADSSTLRKTPLIVLSQTPIDRGNSVQVTDLSLQLKKHTGR